MRTKMLFIYMLIIFGGLGIVTPCSATNPFEENRIEIPAAADNEATAQTDSVATDENLENESSLWEDLKKLYGPLGERSGKRIIKNRPRRDQECHLDGYDELEISIDGDNYCGQFAMSTLLKGMGVEVDPQDIYSQSNPAGIFTSPPTIVEHLRENGIDARMKNKATTTEIAKRIDAGKPVIVLVDSGSGVPHWVCITGYDTDENGKIVSFRMRDSYWGTRGPHTMDIDKFEKAWESPMGQGTLSQLVGYSNVLIDNYGEMDPESAPVFPGNFSTATEDNMASGVNDVVNGWMNKSVTKVISGATKLVVGLPGALLGATSNFADKNGEKLIDWGEKQKAKGGVGNKILGEIASFGGRHASTVAKGGKVVADIWSSGASMVGNSIKKLGSLFS